MSLKRKMLPIGVENFEKLRRNDMYYVDKTEMISDLIMNHGDANLFTRPRRFGKTLTMDMLKTFFEIGQDASLFDGLTISSHSDICEKYQNKYPVVFISLKGATGSTYEKANSMIKQLVAEEYQRHSYLADSDILDSIEKDQFNRIRSISLNEGDLENSLRTLTRLLCKHHNQKVILLIDEYDVPLDKSFLNGYYDDMVSFIRIFLGEALKTNDNTEFAIVTGCLRISKESIFTGVNNFKVFSINDTRFSDYFGFTNDEVREMLSYYGIIDKYETTKAWYDGYLFGKTEIYCPWDVLNHCDTVVNTDDIEPQAYWINSSGNDIIRKFIEMANSTTKSELELLIAGNDLVEERSDAVSGEHALLPVAIFITARLGDDVFDTCFRENERRSILWHIDTRTIGDYSLGTVFIRTAIVVASAGNARHNDGVFRERTSGDDITPQVRECTAERAGERLNNCHLFSSISQCTWPVLRLCNRKTGRYAGMLVIAAFRDRSIRIERLLCDDRKAERHNLRNSPKPRVR